MCGKLACDAFEIDRLVPNGVLLQLTLYPNTPEFCLMTPDIVPIPDYKVVITKASLHIWHAEISPEIIATHSEILVSEPALFPYTKTEIKKFTLSQGVFGAELNNPFESRLPSELVIGMVSGEASHGDFQADPFLFEHNNLNFIQVTCDGEDLNNSPIMTKYSQTPEESLYMDAYKTLCGVDGRPGENPISRRDFFHGYTLYRFVVEHEDTTNSSDVVPLRRTGNVRISMKFDKQLDQTKTVIIFAKFPAGFKIDKNRGVYDM